MKLNTKYEILTPNGYKDFHGIRTIQKPLYYEFTLKNGVSIKSSDNHPFMINGQKILAKDFNKGEFLDTKHGLIEIVDIDIINETDVFYDVVEVQDGNIFYANDIITHNCDFVASGHTVITPDILKWYETKLTKPLEKRGIDGNYWIWEYPDFHRDYMVVADVARGDGGDYSAFHIFDVKTMRQVAEYRGKPGTKDYGNMLVSEAVAYNDALLVIENANIGWAAIQPAIDREYKNLYYSLKQDTKVVDAEDYLMKKYDMKDKKDMTPGFTTSVRTRPMMISQMELYMREHAVEIQSKRLWEELGVFVWLQAGRAEAAGGYNDDLVMALAIAVWVRDTAIKLRTEGMELNRQTLNTLGNSIAPGIYTSGPNTIHESWMHKAGKETIDLTKWI